MLSKPTILNYLLNIKLFQIIKSILVDILIRLNISKYIELLLDCSIKHLYNIFLIKIWKVEVKVISLTSFVINIILDKQKVDNIAEINLN